MRAFPLAAALLLAGCAQPAERANPFEDDVPPPAPVLLAPADGADDVELAPTLKWTPVEDTLAVSYQVEWWPAASGRALARAALGVPLPAHAMTEDLLPGTAYAWRVRAVDAAANLGPWSEPSTFTTTLPSTPSPSRL